MAEVPTAPGVDWCQRNRHHEAGTDVRYGSKTDFDLRPRHFRFSPNRGRSSVQLECPKSADIQCALVGDRTATPNCSQKLL
jgi:hypothetical protein